MKKKPFKFLLKLKKEIKKLINKKFFNLVKIKKKIQKISSMLNTLTLESLLKKNFYVIDTKKKRK